MVWLLTFAVPAAIAAAFYAVARWHDSERPLAYYRDARLGATAIFVAGSLVAVLNTLAYVGL